MTAAPRRDSILGNCARAWTKAIDKPIVIAEPGKYLDYEPDIIHGDRMGAYRNWMFAVEWALNFLDSGIIWMVQDDAMPHKDIKNIVRCVDLDQHVFTAYVNTDACKGKNFGVHRLQTGRSYSGALALAFSRSMLERVFESDRAQDWIENHGCIPHDHSPSEVKHIDTMIGEWAKDEDVAILGCHPSLVEHIGCGLSTLGHDRKGTTRMAGRFIGHDAPSPWKANGTVSCRFIGYTFSHASGMRQMFRVLGTDMQITIPCESAEIQKTHVEILQKNDTFEIL